MSVLSSAIRKRSNGRYAGAGSPPPIALTFQIHGIENTVRNLTSALNRVRVASPRALEIATRIIRDAAAPLTPVDTGATLNSLYKEVVKISRDSYYGEVGYVTWYAPIIHENPMGYTFHRPGAEPKFLEKAVLRNIEAINRALRSTYAQALYGSIVY